MRNLTTNNDLFNFAKELIDLAQINDDKETKQLFEGVINENFITSEILGELLSALEKVQRETHKEYLNSVRDEITYAIQVIKKAFKKTNRLL
jgi:hypothetical protein